MITRDSIREVVTRTWEERTGVVASPEDHIEAIVEGVMSVVDRVFPEDCNCGWGGLHDPDNPHCEANIRRMSD